MDFKTSLRRFIAQIKIKLEDKIEDFSQLLHNYTNYHNNEEEDNMTETEMLYEILYEIIKEDKTYIPKQLTLNGWLESFDTNFYDIVAETLTLFEDD